MKQFVYDYAKYAIRRLMHGIDDIESEKAIKDISKAITMSEKEIITNDEAISLILDTMLKPCSSLGNEQAP